MTGGTRFVVWKMEKPVKSGWSYALAVLVLVALAFGAYVLMPVAEPAKPAADLTQSRNSNNGLYVVSIEPEAGEITQGGLHAWIVTAEDARRQAGRRRDGHGRRRHARAQSRPADRSRR